MQIEVGSTAQCLAVLEDGPATTAEVSVATGIDSKRAGSLLASACARGRVLKRQFKKFSNNDSDDYADVLLWVLPQHAQSWF